MKILKIRLKNLNSLKGEFEVSLEEDPIASSGLFAITGPTGAGKSTLLDAISLALYGTTPRLGNISANTLQDQGGILTRECKDAYAEVKFEVKGKKYLSSWRCKLTRTGNAVQPEMSIADLDEGKSLSEKKSETLKLVKEIVGLDENQFAQSILLSQGKFKEFLEAKADERTVLLENMTGAWIYRKIGKLVHEKHKAIKEEMESLKREIEAIEVLPEEDLKEKEALLKELAEKEKKVKKEYEESTSELKTLNNLQTASDELKKLDEKLIQLKEESEKFQSERNLLNQHEKAISLSPLFYALDHGMKELESRVVNLDRQKKLISEGEKRKGNCLKELSSFIALPVKEEDFIKELEVFKRKIEVSDRELSDAQAAFNPLQNTFRNAFKSFDDATKKKFGTVPEQADAYSKKRVSELEKEINECYLKYNLESKDLSSEIKTLQEALSLFPSLKQLLINEQKNQALQEKLNAKKKEFEKEIPALKVKLEKTISEKEKTGKELELIELKVQNEKLRGELEKYKGLLIKGNPCPLCGEEVKQVGELEDLVLKELLEKQKSLDFLLNQLKDEINADKLKIKALEDNLASLIADLETCQDDLKKNRSIKLQTMQQLNLPEEIQIPEIEKSEGSFQSKKNELESLKDKSLEKTQFEKFLEHLKDYLQGKKLLELAQKNRSSLGVGDTILSSLDELKSAFNKAVNSIEAATKEEASITAEIIKIKEENNEVNNQLELKLKEKGFSDADTARKAILNEKEAERIRIKEQELTNLVVGLSSKKESQEEYLQNLRSQLKSNISYEKLKELNEELSLTFNSILKDTAFLNEKLRQDKENRKKVGDKQAQLEKVIGRFRYFDIIRESIGDAEGKKFSKIMQRFTLRHLIALANERLNEISGRYLLHVPQAETMDADDKGQDQLMVIDRDMGDAVRVVSTLSGGESFLVSLALALALSDLAAGNINIKSFFIDEGFGTLDPETLDLAISTLEKIQAEDGKTVGVISHVDTLKERIACQVRVKKGSSGYSSIEVV